MSSKTMTIRSSALAAILFASTTVGPATGLLGCVKNEPEASNRSGEEPARGEPGDDDHGDDDHGDDEHGDESDASHATVKLSAQVLADIQIKTEKARRRPLPAELRTTGEVDFNLDKLAHVSARLSGRVETVKKTLGDDVKRGAWLVILDSIELGQAKAEYLQAHALEEVARLALAREEVLLKDQIASHRAVLEARGRHLTAASKLDVARERLRLYGLAEDTIAALKFGDPGASSVPVRSPISGRIVEKHVTQGELVTPEKSLFTVADLSAVWVWIDLFEHDLPLVHVGDDVAVTADAVPGRTFVGKIAYIRDEVDRDTRAVRARIDVDNPERNLKPGMYTTVQIADPHGVDGASVASQGLAVPVSALVRDGANTVVFVQQAPGVFERRRVKPGRRSAQVVEILEGVKANDAVVVHGTFFLKSEASKSSLSESEHSH